MSGPTYHDIRGEIIYSNIGLEAQLPLLSIIKTGGGMGS
jgi:hypothetical protein